MMVMVVVMLDGCMHGGGGDGDAGWMDAWW
jgi:hypothetical protein